MLIDYSAEPSLISTLKRPALSLALSLALALTLITFSQGVSASTEQTATNFMQADANGDGALTRGEFKTFIDLNASFNIGRAKMVRDRGLYDRAFGRLDANGDGLVSSVELQNAGQ
ncbi:hypothetical protein [Pseudovibrio sp. SPO723]|uniref:hypothetical protein n=1 Tax=Nesiotobacter zosterae TaxID=392721 RepID=UPI0029C4C4D0|nr:hypothetical protein [Pseudovibrio sp. SPO723]MDX5595715.1 hypothetical protein [Pseudovibrio sp. SPO723]